MKNYKLFFEVIWPLGLLCMLLMLPSLYDAFAKNETHKIDESFFIEESEKKFFEFQKITTQANKKIVDKVELIKKQVTELKEEVQETKDKLIKSEEKNAEYQTKINQMDSVERNVDVQPFDILAILPDSTR